MGIQPIGSVGILLRAFKTGIYPVDTILLKLDELQSTSSLFITSAIIESAKKRIQ